MLKPFQEIHRSVCRIINGRRKKKQEHSEERRRHLIEEELGKIVRPVLVVRDSGFADSEVQESTRLVVAASICPSPRHSVASAASLPDWNEQTSHILRIRTFNTFRPDQLIPQADDEDARFDGPPSIGHIRDPRFPSPHIAPVPEPRRPRLTPPSRSLSLDSTYQGRRLGVDHSSSGHSNSTISNLDLDSYLFANSANERRLTEYVQSSMERVTEGVAMWETEEV